MKGALVSIITPCYNGEAFVGRFLNSVLSQTYDNIELIIINDGSTDRTEELILSYKTKFEDKGYSLIYIYQENAGQSAAINQGLKIFKGEFMTWPDSDDELTKNSVATRVKFLTENPSYGMVICKTEVVSEENYEFISYQQRDPKRINENLFIDLINGIGVYYSPGGYMVRASMFRRAMPKPLQIIAPREVGQNFQLMLPIAYKYPYGCMDFIGYKYTLRKNSHSRQKKTYEDSRRAVDIGKDVLIDVCRKIDMPEYERENCKRLIYKRYVRSLLDVMILYKKVDAIDCVKKIVSEENLLDQTIRHVIFAIEHPFVYKLYKILISIKQRLFVK